MQMPGISILVHCREEEPLSLETVKSILDQSYGNFELILLANPQKNHELNQHQGWHELKRDNRIRTVLVNASKISAEALNKGVVESQAPWLLWVSPFDLLHPNWLEHGLQFISKNSNLAFLYSGQSEGFDFKTILYHDIIPPATIFSKRAWKEVGGFRLNVEGAEAWDFWIACGSVGLASHCLRGSFACKSYPVAPKPSPSSAERERTFAQIKINNRECYPPEEVQVAEATLGKISAEGGKLSFNPARTPMVSIIIPTYNRTDTLKIALDSVLAQTYRDFEIIIVSDCGNNELEDLIKKFNHRQNITYVRHGVNRGLGAARNTGIGVSRGKYIAYLDDDDFFFPNHLEVLVGHLEQSGSKVAYTDAQRVWQHKVDGVYVESKRDAPYSHDFQYEVILVHNFVPVLCFVHAKECITAVGGFDETLGTHEDWDLWIRMSRKYRMDHIKEFTSAFTHREDGTNMTARRKLNFLDTTKAIYAKYPDFVVHLPEVRHHQKLRLRQMRLDLGLSPEPIQYLPKHLEALNKIKESEFASAIEIFKGLIENHTADSLVLNDYANLIAKMGSTDEAENLYREALKMDPGNYKAIADYGEFCFRKGKLKEALELLKAAHQINPNDIQTTLLIAELSVSIGQVDLAEAFYRRILEVEPDQKVALRYLNRNQ